MLIKHCEKGFNQCSPNWKKTTTPKTTADSSFFWQKCCNEKKTNVGTQCECDLHNSFELETKKIFS